MNKQITIGLMPEKFNDKAWNYYGLVAEPAGGIVAYLTQQPIMVGTDDMASAAVHRLQLAAGDTEEMMSEGDSSWWLLCLDDTHQDCFQKAADAGELNAIRFLNQIVGYALLNDYTHAVMQALNGDPIILPTLTETK